MKIRYPAFITVRTGSHRLPAKCLLPFGDGNVLDHVIDRTANGGLFPIVCTTLEPADDGIVEVAERHSVGLFRGSRDNKLRRWLDCCEAYDLEDFHSVDADDPFFDPALVIQSMNLLRGGFDAVYPPASSTSGGASVGYSLTSELLARVCVDLLPEQDTEMIWDFIDREPNVRVTHLPERRPLPMPARLTLDYEEDYWLLATIKRILGAGTERDAVDDLLRRNPDLYKVNWFRNQQWKEAQGSKLRALGEHQTLENEDGSE